MSRGRIDVGTNASGEQCFAAVMPRAIPLDQAAEPVLGEWRPKWRISAGRLFALAVNAGSSVARQGETSIDKTHNVDVNAEAEPRLSNILGDRLKSGRGDNQSKDYPWLARILFPFAIDQRLQVGQGFEQAKTFDVSGPADARLTKVMGSECAEKRDQNSRASTENISWLGCTKVLTRLMVAMAAALFASCSVTSGDVEANNARNKEVDSGAARKLVPVLSNISVEDVSYIPYNIDRIRIRDAYGNTARAGGDTSPGGGSGTLCCYTLRGTKFHVEWRYYDGDEWEAGNEAIYTASDEVELNASEPGTSASGGILALHVFPDMHIELEYPAPFSRRSRIPVLEVTRWIHSTYPELIEKYGNIGVVIRASVRAVNLAWQDYGMRDEQDLREFAYLYLTLGRFFMDHPKVDAQLRRSDVTPGSLAAYAASLSQADIKAIKAFSKKKRLKSPIPLTQGEADL